MAVTSYAYDFEVDGIYYCYDVYGNAVVTHGDKKYTGKIKIPSEVKWNGKKKKVVEIGDYAFECCYELKSVSIPSSVYYIGRFAFWRGDVDRGVCIRRLFLFNGFLLLQ